MDSNSSPPRDRLAGLAPDEWSGWQPWDLDPYERLAGPFYKRRDADGRPVCAFRVDARHLNGHGVVHGGCLMTFADGALFHIASDDLQGARSVTVSFSGEFVEGVGIGDLVQASGTVIRAGGSLVFVQGLVSCGRTPVLAFSGILKKFR